jgi:hypothetical protein
MEQTKTKILPLPDIGDIFFISVMVLLLFARPNFLFSDGSTGWHIVVGNYILEKLAVPHVDILSFTFPGRPWVDYEWLAELVMAGLVHLGGLNLLNVVASASLALLIVMVYRRSIKSGCNFLLVVILTLFGAIASSVHWLARPHLFTLWGVYLFSATLEDYSKGTLSGKKLLVMLSCVALIWVNCHPGFVFGLGILAIYFLCHLIQYLVVEPEELKRANFSKSKWLGLALVVTGVVTLCNPYVFDLHRYLVSYLRQSIVLDVTNEFRSPVFHGDVQPACLAILFAFFVVGLTVSNQPLPFSQLMTVLAFCHFSLSSIRNLPLFVIVALPLIAQLYSRTIFGSDQGPTSSLSTPNPVSKVLLFFQKLNRQFMQTEARCRLHLLPICLFVVLLFISLSGGKILNNVILSINPDQLPLPSKALMAIKRLKLDPKQGFNVDNWGGCLSYRLGIPVFIDDRSDFFGEPFFLQYSTLLNALPGWRELIKKDGIRWVLIPNDTRFGHALEKTLHWRLAERDNVASLYVENGGKND